MILDHHTRTGGAAGPGWVEGLPPQSTLVRCWGVEGWRLCASMAKWHFWSQEFNAKDLLSVLNFNQKQTQGVRGRRSAKQEGMGRGTQVEGIGDKLGTKPAEWKGGDNGSALPRCPQVLWGGTPLGASHGFSLTPRSHGPL